MCVVQIGVFEIHVKRPKEFCYTIAMRKNRITVLRAKRAACVLSVLAVIAAAFGAVGERPGVLTGKPEAPLLVSAIGQKGELHYLLMTMGEEGNNRQRYGVDKEAEIMASKGVDKAYALDGGQTAVIVMQGETVNRVDWAQERTMSDIIYFATAIPEEENEP